MPYLSAYLSTGALQDNPSPTSQQKKNKNPTLTMTTGNAQLCQAKDNVHNLIYFPFHGLAGCIRTTLIVSGEPYKFTNMMLKVNQELQLQANWRSNISRLHLLNENSSMTNRNGLLPKSSLPLDMSHCCVRKLNAARYD